MRTQSLQLAAHLRELVVLHVVVELHEVFVYGVNVALSQVLSRHEACFEEQVDRVHAENLRYGAQAFDAGIGGPCLPLGDDRCVESGATDLTDALCEFGVGPDASAVAKFFEVPDEGCPGGLTAIFTTHAYDCSGPRWG